MKRQLGRPRRNRGSNYEDIHGQSDAKKPVGDESVKVYISSKALRDLPKSGSSITPKVDPYTQVLPESVPYALLNSLNRPIGGQYGGDDNLDGGNTRQYLTSETSNFLRDFDSMVMFAPINYRYLPISDDDTVRGKQFTNEMIKAITEVLSLASATTFTSLAAYQYEVESDIPTGTYSFENPKTTWYGSDAAGLYEWMIHYQVVLQSIAQAMMYFNKFRNNMGEMMRMSWNRETPRLNSFFGLMKKKSFISQWQSLAYTVEGEYFDYAWMQQFNMVGAIISRRADALTEPLLEIACHHIVPSLTLKLGSATIYSSAELDSIMSEIGSSFTGSYQFTTFEGAMSTLAMLLSVNDTLSWVRNDTNTATVSEQERFNMIQDIVQGLNACMNYFKPAMADLRTLLDVLGRVGVNQWSKSVKLAVVSDTDTKAYRNMIVEDLFAMVGGGSQNISWNSTTYRWSGYSIWNMYKGIPEYDSKSGGAFLSFSTKARLESTDDSVAYMPIFFNTFSNILATDRLGNSVTITTATAKASANPNTARLNPLQAMDIVIRFPYTASWGSLNTVSQSKLANVCTKVFGLFLMQAASSVTATSPVMVETDNLCFIVYEIEDLSNEMISYARSNGPFKVNTIDNSRIGFLGMSRSEGRTRTDREANNW